MDKNELKIPDDFFKEGLNGFEVPYREGAWENMSDLLDKAGKRRPFLLWFQKNKKSTFTLITITMITTILISVFTLWNHSDINVADNSKLQKSSVTKQVKSQPSAIDPQTPVIDNKGNNSLIHSGTEGNSGGSYGKDFKQNSKTQYASHSASDFADNPGESVLKNPEESIVLTAEVKAEGSATPAADELENPEIKQKQGQNSATASNNSVLIKGLGNYTTFRGPFLGIHFTTQNSRFNGLSDSGKQSFGFNFQIMSNNLTGRSDFGGHLGVDFGALWYGHGKHYGVVLNNSSLDSGFTRLSTHSFDLLARGHFEYARFRLKPYVNAFAGPRIFATSQYVKAYHLKTNYENSSNTNAMTTVSWMYGGALGARFAISKHVSLDARYEWMQGTETEMVDINKSTFNGVSSFNLKKVKVTPAYSQFKFGVLFDLWDGHEEKKHEPLNQNELVQTTEYFYYDSSRGQYMRVNCRCAEEPVGSDTVNTRKIKHFGTPEDFDGAHKPGEGSGRKGSSPGGTISPGSGGSGKGSFPGIKPGGGGVKIKS